MNRLMKFIAVISVFFSTVLLVALPVKAGPALLFDSTTEQIIYAEDPDHLWYPASLTKLMTAYIVFEELKSGRLTSHAKLYNSAHTRRQPASKIGLPLGARIEVGKSLKILIVKSANDVAMMFAEKIGGSEKSFVARMNKTALRLKMRQTHFENPHGLPHPRQVTTARDMGKLAVALIRDFPEYNHLFKLPSVKLGKRRMRSHNDLLRTYEGADGMKTGFICNSGFNVVASATRNGRRLIAVVLGAKSVKVRRARAKALFDYGFQNYLWKVLFPLKTSDFAVQSSYGASPGNMRSIVCRSRRIKKRRIKKRYRVKRIKKKIIPSKKSSIKTTRIKKGS